MAPPNVTTNDLGAYEENTHDVLADCALCSIGEEDCVHLFFQYPFAHMIWVAQGIPLVDAFLERVL